MDSADLPYRGGDVLPIPTWIISAMRRGASPDDVQFRSQNTFYTLASAGYGAAEEGAARDQAAAATAWGVFLRNPR